MLLNYFNTAVRNFLRQPFYSGINVLGLVLGLTCSIFIFLWVLDELSYDRYHPDNDRVYKVLSNSQFADGHIITDERTSGLLAEALKTQIPEVEQTARAAVSEPKLFKYGETANYERAYYADESIFEVLDLTLLQGNRTSPTAITTISQPWGLLSSRVGISQRNFHPTVVITSSLRRRLNILDLPTRSVSASGLMKTTAERRGRSLA